MPPPPLKMLKTISDKETQVEQLLIDCGYYDTLEVFRNERSKRSRVPAEAQENSSLIEKKGDVWVCTFCEKSFTTKGSAKRHLVSTHSQDSKQFECPRCTSKFARRDDLYTHLRRMHAANQLVESMIEEHKAELKGEHKGIGLGFLMSVVSHNEHLDVVLPSGNTICRPFSTEVNSANAREPLKAAKACRTAKCNHWRVMHDDHEDVLVNGALHHKNEEGEWECHGELGSVEDFEFLLHSAQHGEANTHCAALSGGEHHHHVPEQHQQHAHSHHHHNHHHHDEAAIAAASADHGPDLGFDDFEFLFHSEPAVAHHAGHSHHLNVPAVPQQCIVKPSVESLLLPGGSVLCRRLTTATPRFATQHNPSSWSGALELGHKHGPGCGHQRMRHGNHHDYIVGSIIESDHPDCPMNGASVLEQTDSATLAYVVSALSTEQQQQAAAAAASATSSSSGSPDEE